MLQFLAQCGSFSKGDIATASLLKNWMGQPEAAFGSLSKPPPDIQRLS